MSAALRHLARAFTTSARRLETGAITLSPQLCSGLACTTSIAFSPNLWETCGQRHISGSTAAAAAAGSSSKKASTSPTVPSKHLSNNSHAHSVQPSDRIHLRGMRFYGHHGVLAEETKLGQPFIVDVTLYCDCQEAGRSDNLEQTVSYADAFRFVRTVMEGPPRQLLEAVAEDICQGLLKQHTRLTAVQVAVNKISVPGVAAILNSVGIEVMRMRQ